jgi:hypothetical protein
MRRNYHTGIASFSAQVALAALAVDAFIPPAHAQQQGVIPSFIEHPRIGMQWADFIAAHPSAVILAFGPDTNAETKPDPKKPGEGLVIKLSNPDGLALFNFVDAKLEAVVLSRKADQGYSQQFLDAAKKSFGGGETTSKFPSMPGFDIYTWSKQDRIIQAIVPEGGKPGDVSLRITSLDYAKRIGIAP